MYNLLQLNGMKVAELKEIADQLQITGADKLKKQDLVYKILDVQAVQNTEPAPVAAEPSEPEVNASTNEDATASEDAKPKRDRIRKTVVEKNVVPSAGAPPPQGDLFPTNEETFPTNEETEAKTETTEATEVPTSEERPQQHPRQLQHPQQNRQNQNPQYNQNQNNQNNQNRHQQQQQQNSNIVRPDRSKRGQADEHGYNFDGIVLADVGDYAGWFWFPSFG